MRRLKSEIKAWDRLPGESSAAYEAFKIYLNMPNRSYQRVVNELSKSRQLITRWASNYEWKTRAAAYDSSLVEAERQLKIKRRKMELEKQHELGLLMADKALKGLKLLDEKKMTPYALVQMADVSCKLMNSATELESAADSADKVTSIIIKKAED